MICIDGGGIKSPEQLTNLHSFSQSKHKNIQLKSKLEKQINPFYLFLFPSFLPQILLRSLAVSDGNEGDQKERKKGEKEKAKKTWKKKLFDTFPKGQTWKKKR